MSAGLTRLLLARIPPQHRTPGHLLVEVKRASGGTGSSNWPGSPRSGKRSRQWNPTRIRLPTDPSTFDEVVVPQRTGLRRAVRCHGATVNGHQRSVVDICRIASFELFPGCSPHLNANRRMRVEMKHFGGEVQWVARAKMKPGHPIG